MDGSTTLESREQLSPKVEVYRFSVDDQPDEPYLDFAEDGFLAFRDFIRDLRTKYPDKSFPSDETLNLLNPPGSSHYDLTTYIAEVGSNIAGGAIGRAHGRRFEGKWYAIDPEFQNSEVTKKLIGAVQKDYDEVTLLASTFGYDKGWENDRRLERRGRRQQALVEYYKRLGFVVNAESESYYPRVIEIDSTSPVPMIWRRAA